MVLTRFEQQHPDLDLVRDGMDVRHLAVPILLANCAWPARRRGPVGSDLRGAISVVLALIGFLRWVSRCRHWHRCIETATPQICGRRHGLPSTSSVGLFLGSTLANCWGSAGQSPSASSSRSRVLPRWLGVLGLIVSVLYLLNQGDILATALPGFPVFDLAGLIGSTGWGLGWPHLASRSGPAQGTSGFDACECLTG